MNRRKQVKQAVAEAGGREALAKRLKITAEAIRQWEGAGKVPAERVLQVERATHDGEGRPRVTRHDLRPDIYPEAA